MATGSKKQKGQFEKLSYEDAMTKLEEVVDKLENGELPLEESLNAFESGMTLAKACEDKLNAANGRVQKIMKNLNAEEIVDVEEDFFEK